MPLYRNDAVGEFPKSWYAATTDLPAPRAALEQDTSVDVAIVGAGFTGLNAAITLRARGLSVAVVDAHRAGWGASGRNGGQVGSDFNKSQLWIEKRLGRETAQSLWALAHEATDMVAGFCADHAPDAMFKNGIAHGDFSADDLDDERRLIDHMDKHYPDHRTTVLDRNAFGDLVKTELYQGGTLNMRAGHVHPLRYVIALANRAEALGAHIYETTPVTSIAHGAKVKLTTPKSVLTADHVILAGNGYIRGLARANDARVMPVNSFIGATEPLGDQAAVIRDDIAVCDSSNVVNYFRMTHDGRLLFGGRANYSLTFPADMGSALHKRMGEMFPQIADVPFSHVWGGTLGISVNRLPVVRRIAPNVLSAGGYSGHGVALAGLAGRVMAEAITGQASRFDTLSSLPQWPMPLGPYGQSAMLPLAMAWFSLRDRIGI